MTVNQPELRMTQVGFLQAKAEKGTMKVRWKYDESTMEVRQKYDESTVEVR